MPKKITKDEFEQQLKIEHPELELNSDYLGNKNYVVVTCKKHNHTFRTTPNRLHRGEGCLCCYNERRGNKTRKNVETFISEARKIHGDKYSYDKVVYKNNKTEVCITCKEHGDFFMKPNKHLSSKQGCPKCHGKHITTEEWILRAKLIHGETYGYENVKYSTNRTKVLIRCKKHGIFKQAPEKHLEGEGCPICKESKLEKFVAKKLQKLGIIFERQKHFKWLDRLSLDFYIPSKNIAIECQGRQHFMNVDIFGGECGYKIRLKNDLLKKEKCLKNELKLIYIVDDDIFKQNLLETHNNIYDNSVYVYQKKELSNSIFKSILKD